VDRAQATRLEVGEPWACRLHSRADRLHGSYRRLPDLRHPHGIARQQDEVGTAGERLSEDHPADHPTGLSGPGDLSHALLATHPRSDREGAPGERPRPPGGDHQLKARKMDAHDHTNVCSHTAQGNVRPGSAHLERLSDRALPPALDWRMGP